MILNKEIRNSLISKNIIHGFSKWKAGLSVVMMCLIPIYCLNKYQVKSNTISEEVAFCKNHASSYIPFNDPNYLENYEIVYNYCLKEVKKQQMKLAYEKEIGKLTPIERKEMKNKLLKITSENQTKCKEAKKEISPGFFICDLIIGKGRTASEKDYIFVEYIGKNVEGIEFDTSYARASFFSFTIGQGQVIKGWDKGLKNMKEGGIRKLIIPPELAYGNQNKGEKIPANSTLVFLVHLLKVN